MVTARVLLALDSERAVYMWSQNVRRLNVSFLPRLL